MGWRSDGPLKKIDGSIQPTFKQFAIIHCALRISRMLSHLITCHGRLVLYRARQPMLRGKQILSAGL
jgi:hypothetical protein